jgi:subtilisin
MRNRTMPMASRNLWRLVAGQVVLAALLVLVPAAATQAATSTSKPYVVVLRNSVTDPGVVAAQHGKKYGFQAKFVYRAALKGYAASLAPQAVSAIQNDPRVAFVSPDEPVQAAASTQAIPFGVKRIGGTQSSTVSGDGQGSVNVNVAVLDSGIDPNHADLNVVGGRNCANGHSFADAFGHGTEVAGVIGARDNDFGVVGIAPGTPLWAVRVLNDKGKASTSSLLCGIDYVTSTRTDADPSNDIQVANMSIQAANQKVDQNDCGVAENDPVHEAICRSVAAGVLLVAAAGNFKEDLQNIAPAKYDEVLTATAIADFDGQSGGLAPSISGCPPDVDDTAADFSDFATLPADQAHTLAAPGNCIRTTYPGNLYTTTWGTSLAAPYVTGTVALCIASGPCAGKTPAQIMSLITGDAAAYNQADTGYGFVGDPANPISGKYYGWLIRAGLY